MQQPQTNQQLTKPQILQLITTTYTSTTTAQVAYATNTLTNYLLHHYPSSFKLLEDILAKDKQYLDSSQKKSLTNLVRVAGFGMLKLCKFASAKEQDVFSQQKNLLFTIQHILDNKQIEIQYRQFIIQPFIEIFVSLTPQNHSKILSKGRYYLNTKQQLFGLQILEAYRESKILFKFKSAYHQQLISLLMQYILGREAWLKESKSSDWSALDMKIMKKYLSMFEQVWITMTFEKHQHFKHRLLTSNELPRCLSCFINNDNCTADFAAEIYSIISDIVMTLGRCHVYHRYQPLISYIKPIVEDQLISVLAGKQNLSPETQGVILKMIVNAVQYRLIEVNLNAYQLYQGLIYPNFLVFERYFNRQQQNIQQIIHFIDDASYHMESSCPQIIRNQLLINICRYSASSAISMRQIFYTFYSHHLPQTLQFEPIHNRHVYAHYHSIWPTIAQKYNNDARILSIMLHTSLLVSLFVADLDFIKLVEEIMSKNAIFFIRHNNHLVIFYSLLIYRNYMDDSFEQGPSIQFREIIVSIALQQSIKLPILNELAREILKQRFSDQPNFYDCQQQIKSILSYVIRSPKYHLYSLITQIFRVYGDHIGQQMVVKVVSAAIKGFGEREDKSQNAYWLLQVFKYFFKIDSCRKHYKALMSLLINLSQSYLKQFCNLSQQFLHLIQVYIGKADQLPEYVCDLMVKWEIVIDNKQILESVNLIVSKTRNKDVLQWLINRLTEQQLTIFTTLALHNLIYYAHSILSEKTIRTIITSAYHTRLFRRHHFDYLNGKLNLIFIYLLRYAWNQTNHLLLNQNWTEVTEKAKRDILLHRKLIGRGEEIGVRPFVQQIYDLIYGQQNIYRWKYDMQLFLKLQLQIIQLYISDPYQLMYANMIFTAVTMNMNRAYYFIHNNYHQTSSSSDQSLNPRTQLQKQYRATKSIVEGLTVPLDLKQKDYFSLYRSCISLLRRNKQSQRWMNILLQVIFKKKGMSQFSKLLTMQKNEKGVYRKINRIKRMVNDDFPSNQ